MNEQPRPDPLLAVAFTDVTQRYGDVTALDTIDVAIPSGQTVALLGPNGAGKSTAISLLLGLLEPSAGRVATLGQAPRAAIASGRVGSMLQSAGLPTAARVGELVDFARALYPSPLARDDILPRAGLEALAGRRVDSLSGGETQRVRFALAIAGDPDLLFLDEPTVAMDVESRQAFWRDMRALGEAGRTVLFATHYLEEADAVADRIVVLSGGRVVADGTPAALKANAGERRVRFSLPADASNHLDRLDGVVGVSRHGSDVTITTRDADATVRALARSQVPFRDIEVVGPDLEGAFLALTTQSQPIGATR